MWCTVQHEQSPVLLSLTIVQVQDNKEPPDINYHAQMHTLFLFVCVLTRPNKLKVCPKLADKLMSKIRL